MNKYNITTDFSEDEADKVGGRSTIRTAALDAELAAIKTTTDSMVDNVAYCLKPDGTLRNSSILPQHLSEELLTQMFSGLGYRYRGEIKNNTEYLVDDVVSVKTVPILLGPRATPFKRCITSHISPNTGTGYLTMRWTAPMWGSLWSDNTTWRTGNQLTWPFDFGKKYYGIQSNSTEVNPHGYMAVSGDFYYDSSKNDFGVRRNTSATIGESDINPPIWEYAKKNNTGSTTISFNNDSYVKKVISGIQGIESSSIVIAKRGLSSTDKSNDELIIDGCSVFAGDIVAGVGFTIMAYAENGMRIKGTFPVTYFWSNL